jgi:multiple antibiotic resistance protein
VLPVYHALTGELAAGERRRVLRHSVLTAFLVSVGFALAGKVVFRLLGIEVYDFKIAGGLLLLAFSIQDLMAGDKARRQAAAGSHVGVVPLGMPLIVGPAVLTTILILLDTHGYPATMAALALNMAIVWLALRLAPAILARIGEGGAKALGKLAGLLLAAVGVRMIRLGLTDLVAALSGVAGS